MIMTKIDPDGINKYLTWLRNIQLYPPQYSPEEYADWIEMSEARAKMILIKTTMETDLTDKEKCAKIAEIINTDLEVEVYE